MKKKDARRDIAEFIANPAFQSVAREYGLEDGGFLLLGTAPAKSSTLYFVNERPILNGVSAMFKKNEDDYFYTSPKPLSRVARLTGSSGHYIDDAYLRRLLEAQVYYVREDEGIYNLELFLDADEWLDGNVFLKAVNKLAEKKDCFVITHQPELWHIRLEGAKGPWGKGLWAWRAIWAQNSDGSAFSVLCAIESGATRIVPNLRVVPLMKETYSLKSVKYLTTRLMRFTVSQRIENLLERFT